jgi:hypothetical protein
MCAEYFEIITPCGHICLSLSEIIGIIAVLITVAALSYSLFASTYSNFLHNSEIAWVNWRLAQKDGKKRDYWRDLAERYRDGAQRRACSGNLSFWSLLAAIASLVVIFTRCKWFIPIPFWISVSFIIAAFIFFTCEKIPRRLLRLRVPLGRHLQPQFWDLPIPKNKDLEHLRKNYWHYEDDWPYNDE